EQFAAPLLGFLPLGQGVSVRSVDAFDALSGPRAIEALRAAHARLSSLPTDDREVIEAELTRRLGDLAPRGGAITATLKLCDAALRHAQGYEDQPEALCGMTAELARVLRAGDAVLARLVGEAGGGGEEGPPADGPLSDDELLRRYGRGVL